MRKKTVLRNIPIKGIVLIIFSVMILATCGFVFWKYSSLRGLKNSSISAKVETIKVVSDPRSAEDLLKWWKDSPWVGSDWWNSVEESWRAGKITMVGNRYPSSDGEMLLYLSDISGAEKPICGEPNKNLCVWFAGYPDDGDIYPVGVYEPGVEIVTARLDSDNNGWQKAVMTLRKRINDAGCRVESIYATDLYSWNNSRLSEIVIRSLEDCNGSNIKYPVYLANDFQIKFEGETNYGRLVTVRELGEDGDVITNIFIDSKEPKTASLAFGENVRFDDQYRIGSHEYVAFTEGLSRADHDNIFDGWNPVDASNLEGVSATLIKSAIATKVIPYQDILQSSDSRLMAVVVCVIPSRIEGDACYVAILDGESVKLVDYSGHLYSYEPKLIDLNSKKLVYRKNGPTGGSLHAYSLENSKIIFSFEYSGWDFESYLMKKTYGELNRVLYFQTKYSNGGLEELIVYRGYPPSGAPENAKVMEFYSNQTNVLATYKVPVNCQLEIACKNHLFPSLLEKETFNNQDEIHFTMIGKHFRYTMTTEKIEIIGTAK